MFQRLKGAIDNRIAEEQARQRQAALSAQPTRPPQRRRAQGQHGDQQRVSSRQRDAASISSGKAPDPSVFEPEFAIGEDDSGAPSRVATPKPEVKEKESHQEQESKQQTSEGDGLDTSPEPVAVANDKTSEINGGNLTTPRPQELPTEVRVKLRKLDRMDTKYAELLNAYRLAHTKVQAIDNFEASLRENTPLTSINDPGAFVEYLNQVNLKSDMVLDELKRITADRDEYKKQLEASEKATATLREELQEAKTQGAATDYSQSPANTDPAATTVPSVTPTAKEVDAEPAAKSPASTSSRIASFSLFSPRSKATSPPARDTSEDLFSFDSEHAKLELDLQERQSEIEELTKQVNSLKGDLKVARESTESMVESLETSTREVHALRDAKDKFDGIKTGLERQIDELENDATSSNGRHTDLQREVDILRAQKRETADQLTKLKSLLQELEANKAQLEEEISSKTADINILNEKLSQKDSVVKDLEDTLAMHQSAERQDAAQKKNDQSSEKKLITMQKIMDSLRGQLDTAETTVAELKAEIQSTQDEYSQRPSTKAFGFFDEASKAELDHLTSRDDVVKYISENFGTKPNSGPPVPSTTGEPAAGQSKKKNKKKKKGKGPQGAADEAEIDAPIKVSENLAEVIEAEGIGTDKYPAAQVSGLEQEIAELKTDLASKVDAIERLTRQLKDQEALREEIETLRDDLLHQGEEHVEARDALKVALSKKTELQDTIEKLEKELMESRKAAASGADSAKAHKDMVEQFDQLQSKCSTLERDLAASEQLATGRYKDITDLKELLSKVQPELRSLRNEVAELKTAKDDLKNKTGELNRLEARHDDIKAEIKGLSKRLGDKDSEIKDLQKKVDQETTTRTRVEKDLDAAQVDLRNAESRRQEAVFASEQLRRELTKSKEDYDNSRGQLRGLEEQISIHSRQVSELKEELSLKTALHSSSQNLVQSLRDQAHELKMQAREASTRADSVEEELAEAQRMLSERTREGQTMRMLLDQSETGTESRIREMKERMDAAIEERDRVEDEASVSSRRMMREVEEARNKAREAQRALNIAENEREELETRQRDWKRRRDELEQVAARAAKEVEEVRSAMTGLREALDESERQVRELDIQKMDLRRMGDEAKDRVEVLTKANKNLTEELKAAQAGLKPHRLPSRSGPGAGFDSGAPSSRTSIDSSNARSPAAKDRGALSTATSRAETPTTGVGAGVGGGMSQGNVDYVYLKNVLLQFLEQRDKGHQRQLIPVLGMLLHFDRKDEQRWNAAISAR